MDSGPVRAGREEPPQSGGGRGDRRGRVNGWRRRPVSSDRADAIYYATYTAFDGSQVAPHLLETSDFRTFTISQLSDPSARNKGMPLFPSRIAGRYATLSRWDRKSNAVAYSDDAHDWSEARIVQSPARPWALIRLGNCGSPIETPMGWLVFTHGAGPMRERHRRRPARLG